MIKTDLLEYTLNFKFQAGTSRGVMNDHHVIYLILKNQETDICGIGECAPLPGLSIENTGQVKSFLEELSEYKFDDLPTQLQEISEYVSKIVPQQLPSVRFGLETAILDYNSGGSKKIFDGDFFNGEQRIPINGLIWMGDKGFMVDQIKSKINSGFDCLKMKIGAIDFQTELDILGFIRNEFNERDLTIRVDANGAFSFEEALSKLGKLSKFGIHSIEQPIKAGNVHKMHELCRNSPLPIALDEELIGIPGKNAKLLLEEIRPQYIILKPTLIGGLGASEHWITTAADLNIGWWMTSALESNIGLNAITQYTGIKNVSLPQGLGTGQLYHNNIESPLTIENGEIFYEVNKNWNLSVFK